MMKATTKTKTTTEQASWGDALILALYPLMAGRLHELTDEERLSMLAEVARTVEDELGQHVSDMRSSGRRGYNRWEPTTGAALSDRYTWQEIGACLGVPKSTAQRRYQSVAPRERTR